MLEQNEIDILNNTIKSIYRIKSSTKMRLEILKNLKELIDYQLGTFCLGGSDHGKTYLADTVTYSDYGAEYERDFLVQGELRYEKSDYAEWLFEIPETVVYKDSELVSDEVRKKTHYYKDYLLKFDLPHVGGISIATKDHFLGALTLYKNAVTGDFTDKDMYVFNFLQLHLETRLSNDEDRLMDSKKNASYILKADYKLTTREIDILKLVLKGETNEEISNSLFITRNTVKKHLSHIYDKLEVGNRAQLIQFVLDKHMTFLW